MLDIQNLTMKYGQSQILNNMSLSAKAGEVTVVMGTNGVGKTSLLKAISGRFPYVDGTITLGSCSITLAQLTPPRQGSPMCPKGAKFSL